MSEEFVAERPARAPVHPGEILREDVLPALNLQVKEAARHLGVTRQHLHRVLAEEADVSPDMAVRLGKFCGNGPHLWLAMQGALNLWRSTVKLSQELERIPTMNASKASLDSA